MQRDLCASLPVLHLCDRFAMMYDSRVSLSTRASGFLQVPFRWNKHLFSRPKRKIATKHYFLPVYSVYVLPLNEQLSFF